MIVVVSRFFVPNGYAAMAIFPFVFFKKKEYVTRKRKNHENIHIKQQLEMLILPFYIWYGIEFLVRWVQYKDRNKAYRNISFEREAYSKDYNLSYLKIRKMYSFTKYLKS